MFLTTLLVLTRLSLVLCTPPDTDSLFFEFSECETLEIPSPTSILLRTLSVLSDLCPIVEVLVKTFALVLVEEGS